MYTATKSENTKNPEVNSSFSLEISYKYKTSLEPVNIHSLFYPGAFYSIFLILLFFIFGISGFDLAIPEK